MCNCSEKVFRVAAALKGEAESLKTQENSTLAPFLLAIADRLDDLAGELGVDE